MATSSSRFFGSPTATLPCPDSDQLPASAAACSHRATASPLAPGSHPSRRISPSRRRWYASTRPLPAPRLPPYVPPPVVSGPRSSALPYACSSTFLFPFPPSEIILSFVRKEGIRSERLPLRRQYDSSSSPTSTTLPN